MRRARDDLCRAWVRMTSHDSSISPNDRPDTATFASNRIESHPSTLAPTRGRKRTRRRRFARDRIAFVRLSVGHRDRTLASVEGRWSTRF